MLISNTSQLVVWQEVDQDYVNSSAVWNVSSAKSPNSNARSVDGNGLWTNSNSASYQPKFLLTLALWTLLALCEVLISRTFSCSSRTLKSTLSTKPTTQDQQSGSWTSSTGSVTWSGVWFLLSRLLSGATKPTMTSQFITSTLTLTFWRSLVITHCSYPPLRPFSLYSCLRCAWYISSLTEHFTYFFTSESASTSAIILSGSTCSLPCSSPTLLICVSAPFNSSSYCSAFQYKVKWTM